MFWGPPTPHFLGVQGPPPHLWLPPSQAHWPSGTHSPALPTLYSRRTHARTRSDPRAGNPDSPSEGGSFQAPLERPTGPEPVEAHSSTTRRCGLLYVPGIHPRVSITLATSRRRPCRPCRRSVLIADLTGSPISAPAPALGLASLSWSAQARTPLSPAGLRRALCAWGGFQLALCEPFPQVQRPPEPSQHTCRGAGQGLCVVIIARPAGVRWRSAPKTLGLSLS